MTTVSVRRTFKDSLFRLIFREKKELLDLYNAINGSCYRDPDALEINTIEGILYMGIKNDVSFLIDEYLNLYEAQSSWNPNMPIRGLIYFSHIYEGYIARNQLDLYSSAALELPSPRYIVFYNGTRAEADCTELRLSDSFHHKETNNCLECTATVLNINYGHNEQLMHNCRKLYEYAYLVHNVREWLRKGAALKEAIDRAIDDCIQHDILKGFLLQHRGEVANVILTGYDTEIHMKTEFKKGIEKGRIEAAKDTLLSMLSRFGPVPQDLSERIHGQTDYECLQKWLSDLFQCQSLEEFVDKM